VVDVRALSKLNWIAPRMNTPAREVFTQFFRREGLEPPGQVIECSSLVAIRELLRESDRAALLPAKQVEIDVELGLLAVSPLTLDGTARDIGLSFRRDWRPTKLQNTFVDILRARYGEAAPE
jgi:DNA-binding transcriptional LysR family regulator